MSTAPLVLAVALDGTGWHPAAWREPTAEPHRLTDPRYWVDLAQRAEQALVDLVTLEDSLGLQSADPLRPDDRTDRVRGRLDAVLVASRIAPLTRHVGLVPTVTTTHTEPFHASKAIATLDYVSQGRAGVRLQVSPRADQAAHFGRRAVPELSAQDLAGGHPLVAELLDEAGEYADVLRLLWDSWEDDAEIRDIASGRFVDVDKLHHIDFVGRFFSVKGPSITPRPPQGQPLVVALAHGALPARFAAAHADLVLVTPDDALDARRALAQVRDAQAAAGRAAEPVHVVGDLVVVLDRTREQAQARLARLDERAGAPLFSDARVVAGSAADVADVLAEWHEAGLSGVRLRPAVLPDDLDSIASRLLPELQHRGLACTEAQPGSLRARLGLPRPANRLAAVAAG